MRPQRFGGKKLKAGRKPRVPGEPNLLEMKFGLELERRKYEGQVLEYQFEAETLRIAWPRPATGVKGATYTPDYRVITADGEIVFYECKPMRKNGKPFAREDAMLKLKLAADRHPYRFVIVMLDRATGQWVEQEY